MPGCLTSNTDTSASIAERKPPRKSIEELVDDFDEQAKIDAGVDRMPVKDESEEPVPPVQPVEIQSPAAMPTVLLSHQHEQTCILLQGDRMPDFELQSVDGISTDYLRCIKQIKDPRRPTRRPVRAFCRIRLPTDWFSRFLR